MAKHFSNLMKTTKLQNQEVQHSPNIKKPTKKMKVTSSSRCSKAVKKRKPLKERQKTYYLRKNKGKRNHFLLERMRVRGVQQYL